MKTINLILVPVLGISLLFTTFKLNFIEKNVNDIEKNLNTISNNLQNISENISLINEIQIKETEIIGNILKEIEKNDYIYSSVEKTNVRKVVATIYHPVPEQTDSTPDITADGTKFNIEMATEYRYIAISRDLHTRYGGYLNFNDVVYVESDEIRGFFIVKDLMNARFTDRIDFLFSPNSPIFKLEDVNLYETNIKIVA